MKNPMIPTFLVLVLMSSLAWATPNTSTVRPTAPATQPKITLPKQTTPAPKKPITSASRPISKGVTPLPPIDWEPINTLAGIASAANKLMTLRYSVTPYLSLPPQPKKSPKELAARFAKCGFKPWHLADLLYLVPSKSRDTEQFKIAKKYLKDVYVFQTPSPNGGQPGFAAINVGDKVTTRTFAPYEITLNEVALPTQTSKSLSTNSRTRETVKGSSKKGFKIQIISHPASQDILTFAENCQAPLAGVIQ